MIIKGNLHLRPMLVDDYLPMGGGGCRYIINQTMLNKTDCLVFLGIGNEWSFEKDFLDKTETIPIYGYDFSQETSDFLEQERCHFYPYRVVGQKQYFTDITVDDIFKSLEYNSILFKCDIEGYEYQLIDDIIKHKDRIVGIVIEFHWIDKNRKIFDEAIRRLCEHFDIIHLHRNINAGFCADGLPIVPEMTFIKKGVCEYSGVRKQLPVRELDEDYEELITFEE